MIFKRLPVAQSLPEWLDLATRDIAPSAAARVRIEIESHYLEAVKARMDDGFSGPAAQAQALADLGDAPAAARRFRRVYLTKKEVWFVDLRSRSAVNFIWPIVGCLLFPAVVFPNLATLPGDDGPSRIFSTVAMLLSFVQVVLIFATWVMAQGQMNPAVMRRIILLDSFAVFNFIVLALICGREEKLDGIHESREILDCLAYTFFNLWVVARIPLNFLRLRRKLQAAGDDDLRPV